MAVTIRLLDDIEATIEDYEWRSSDARIASSLRQFLPLYGPSGADPDPDRTVAEAAIATLGGEIIQADEPPELDPEAIY
jgi:hypothetical protein